MVKVSVDVEKTTEVSSSSVVDASDKSDRSTVMVLDPSVSESMSVEVANVIVWL